MSSYAWEGSIERSWDALVEDEHGVLRSAGAAQSRGDGRAGGDRWAAGREEGDAQGRTVCRNMIRYLCVVVDMSRAMNESDLRPTRRNAVMEVLGEFVPTFFDENPLSCMSLFACTDGLCQRLSDMSGSAKAHLGATEVLAASGEFSLQNGLDLARAALHSVPQHGSKEILVLMASLSTCDQGDVFESIDALVKKGIRCSVVGLGSAEVYVAKYATQKTKGVYGVARDRAHLRHLIMDQVQPPAVLTENRNGLRCSFVRMGFPSQRESRTQAGGVHGGVSMTRQALSNNGAGQPTITSQGFYCPRCNSICDELPCSCPICGLELIASSHLARSYHHLFPVPRYRSVTVAEAIMSKQCSGCGTDFADQIDGASHSYFQCPKCETYLCDLCESFIHESLHNCPACLERSAVRLNGQSAQPVAASQ
mmetsp:Transcript_17886/g.45403  ORF Transcript_17886/g.45403 Transcript_17886/m.45403 type:complete len:423 (+) Transcript_17886:203-1471(+)